MSTPGIGDPYWYEWYVGLEQIIKMINPDNGISYVMFQSNVHNTIDDVIVGFENKQEVCYQVKHEIGNVGKSNLTFHKLIESAQKENVRIKESLITALAKGWKEAEELEGKEIIPVLYTNRGLGVKQQKRNFGNKEYTAIPLAKFIKQIQTFLNQSLSLEEIDQLVTEENLKLQFMEFRDAIGEDDSQVLRFVKALQIRSNEGSLDDLEKNMLGSLQKTFRCDYVVAKNLFDKLCSNLRIWTTTRRENVKVTLEDVFNVMSIENDLEHGEHKLPYPNPFFESRKKFCDDLIYNLKNTDKRVVFISGEPGSGKTSLISYLQLNHNLFTARYHTFKPISPEQKFYNSDEGLCTARSLWNDLLIQLRIYFKNQLHKYNIPVVNALCTVEQMRSEVLRLSELLYKKTNEKTILCIDGIDHAARSSMEVTFLNSLFNPSEIPEGVCIVIVGQPADMYDKYPLWIKNKTSGIEHYAVPPLTIVDIKDLILAKKLNYKVSIDVLAEFIFAKTKGNNLSVVFAIEEARNCNNIDELSGILDEKHINSNITNYYTYIWKHVSKRLNAMGTGFAFPDTVVASAIILLNGRLDAAMLSEAINFNFFKEDWEELLDSLYPLIQKIDNQNEYALYHNDFRIFLMATVNKDGAKYKRIALQLAEYYMAHNKGVDGLVNLIPMLVSAGREDLIAKVFDSKFVIHSLAEGISRRNLNEYASLAYKSSLDSRDWQLFHSVYLAINTLQQHHKYFEYYDRKYEVLNKSYSRVLQSYEMHVPMLTEENLYEYRDMLVFCEDLINYKDQISYLRAKSTFYLWMQNLTPPIFIRTLEQNQEESMGTWDPNVVKDIMKRWGKLSVIFEREYVIIKSDEYSKEEINVSIEFNEIYFECLLKKNEIKKAIELIRYGGVSYKCIEENLQNILFKYGTREFNAILKPLINGNLNLNSKLLAMVCLIDSGQVINLDDVVFDTDIKPITYITNETSLTVILWSVIKGYQHWNMDVSIVTGEIYKLIDPIERQNRDFDYLKTLIRQGIILGRAKKCNEKEKQLLDKKLILESYENFFVGDIQHVRTFDFKEGFILLLFLSLKEEWVNKCIDIDILIQLAEDHLFNKNQLGMYYKDVILDFLVKNNRIETVRNYISKLYGPHGSNLFQGSGFDDTHNHFMKNGGIVLPELMNEVSNKIKWDVVAYVDHKEYALWPLLEYYKKISIADPSQWESRGVQLYKLSYVADMKGSNRASFEIQKEVANSAVKCGFKEIWSFRQQDRECRFSLELLYNQLLTLINSAKTVDEILTLWYLSCGILSWYNQDDRRGIRNIYNTCIQKSNELGIKDINLIFEKNSKNHSSLATSMEEIGYKESSDDYSLRREQEKKELIEELSGLSNSELVEVLKYESFESSKWTYIDIGWKLICDREMMSEEIANEFFEIVVNSLESYAWGNSGCSKIVQNIIRYLGANIAWELAAYNYMTLGDSDQYYTCSSNMNSILQWVSDELGIDLLQTIFDNEVECHYSWITGCGYLLEEFDYYDKSITNLPQPQTIQEFSLNILMEQFETRNAHRIEVSIQGIQLLMERYPELFEYISEAWSTYNFSQKEFIFKLSERWSQQNIKGFYKLVPIIEQEYLNTNELDKVIQLYLILQNYNAVLEKRIEKIKYNAEAKNYIIPDNIPPIFNQSNISNSIRHFLVVMESCTFDDNEDLIYFLNNLALNIDDEMKGNSRDFSRPGDSFLYPLNHIKAEAEVLYGEEKKGRWKHVPVSIKAQSLLQMDDTWVISEMPKLSNSEVWDIEEELKGLLKKNALSTSKSFFEKIAHENIEDTEAVIGACLWYPIDRKDGIIYTESLKMISNQILIKDRSITRTLNPGSIISNMDELFEIEYEDVFETGVCLTNAIVGSTSFMYGNCMIYPSEYFRELFGIKPLKNNPLIWVDKDDNEVMYFERLVYPHRKLLQESYFRQPILSRWVCNKELINKVIQKNNLTCYLANNVEEMPKFGV
ncbi:MULTISPECIES: ATP-binding protein [Bacillus cereus group]|uniref:ATP-binding protein n=1 Tax=Bacillus cereus group TaxID=86661 RepID=UPI000279EAA6|nr:ATP-binding protein [Bacillus cereus]EJR29741.1 hypothetical protein IIE_04981 [Bacillus cereus VD045]HDR4347815.1 ATP-binding protein [Bacillus cereus]